MREASDEVSTNRLPSIIHLADATDRMASYRRAELLHALAKDESVMLQYEQRMRDDLDKLERSLAEFEPHAVSDEERQALAEFRRLFEAYGVYHEKIIALSRAAGRRGAGPHLQRVAPRFLRGEQPAAPASGPPLQGEPEGGGALGRHPRGRAEVDPRGAGGEPRREPAVLLLRRLGHLPAAGGRWGWRIASPRET